MTTPELSPEERRVVELFTVEELEALVEALGFAGIAARESGQDFSIDLERVPGVEWTPEKREAYSAHLKAFLARQRGERP